MKINWIILIKIKFQQIFQKMNNMEINLEKRINNIEKKMDNIEKRMDNIENRLDNIKDRVYNMKEEFTKFQKGQN